MNERARASHDELRVALVGYGLAGAVFHAPLIAETPGLSLTHVVTRDAARSRDALRDHPGARVVSTLDAVWDGGEVDLVVLATPNKTHVALACAALEKGAHVVVDKPFAPTAAEGTDVANLAREKRRLVVPFHNRRWDGDFLTLRHLLADGALGEPLRFESRFDRWRPLPKGGWRESGDPIEAGGLLYDLGPHLIDQALLLFGPVARVYCELDRRRTGVQSDDDVFVALEHRNGVRSHLHMTVFAGIPGPRLRMLGTRASYTKYGLDPQEAALRQGARPYRSGYGADAAEHWGTVGAPGVEQPVRTEDGGYQRFYEGMVAAIRDGARPPVDVRDAIAGLAVIEAARASATTHTVTVPAHDEVASVRFTPARAPTRPSR